MNPIRQFPHMTNVFYKLVNLLMITIITCTVGTEYKISYITATITKFRHNIICSHFVALRLTLEPSTSHPRW